MLDRDVRMRLLHVIEIMRCSDGEMSVKDIIFNLQRYIDPWYLVERRAIYSDLKVLEFMGYVKLRSGRNNSLYASWNPDILHREKTLQPKRIS